MRKSILLLAVGLACSACSSVTVPASTPLAVAVSPAEPLPPLPPASDLLVVEASMANRALRADQRSSTYVRIRLDAKPMREGRRPPINLGLVVDTSGSMEGDAIKDARAASLMLLDSLTEGDRLAVVSFNSETEVLVPSTRLDAKSILRVREQIGAMKARGTTDLAGGLRVGIDQVAQNFRANGVNRIVLLGDGVPNDERAVMPIVQLAAQRAIAVTVLGLGLDYNETLMNTIAQQTGGKYHFIRDSSAVASVFKEQLLRLQQVVAKNAQLRLQPGPGVTIEEVIGLPSSPSGGKTQVALGDLSEGEQRDVLVRVSVAGRHAGSVVEIMDAELSFDGVAFNGRRFLEQSFIGARSTLDAKELASGRDADVERSAARVRLAASIVQAIALARGGNVPAARHLLDEAERDARAAAESLGDAELSAKAKTIPALRNELAALAPPPVPIVAPGSPRPTMAPAAAPTAPAVIESHADATRTIQGN